MKQKLKILKFAETVIVIGVITFVLLEVVLAVYIRYAKIRIELPTYTLENTQNFWFDLNKDFGTLHLSKDSYRQKKYCFDVIYNTNSKGFRDTERSLKFNKSRVVALGDSFTEGIGVTLENRVTNLLEQNTEIPHLNFGLAGNFGPVQYLKLYETLAIDYDHDAILVGILPANDFIDDDYDIALKVSDNRYKPFLVGDYPNYKTVYHISDIEKSKAKPREQSFKGKLLKNFTHSYNFYRYLKAVSAVNRIPDNKRLLESAVPSYFNYTKEQLQKMRYCIEQIKLLAGERPVMVYSIPAEKEITAYRNHGKNPLGEDLERICNNANVEYLDLLLKTDEYKKDSYKELYLPCDGHWSDAGNAFAEKHIKANFSYYRK